MKIFFGRWNDKPEFTYLGIGRVGNYTDNFTEVFNKDGSRTFCLKFELSCRDELENPAFINNFDGVFEDLVSTGGKTKYVRHKTRERNPEIIKAKKREFLAQHGKLFCEACGFDFKAVYGPRGDGFIECHHNIPLHEDEHERITRTTDLSLLCSNCHRMVHRKKDWLTIRQLKNLIDGNQNNQRFQQ